MLGTALRRRALQQMVLLWLETQGAKRPSNPDLISVDKVQRGRRSVAVGKVGKCVVARGYVGKEAAMEGAQASTSAPTWLGRKTRCGQCSLEIEWKMTLYGSVCLELQAAKIRCVVWGFGEGRWSSLLPCPLRCSVVGAA
ncbi:hypothetical protein B0T24DRAFT_325091 [Lasiosphaeria ovina]|uniref:Uncharacterized protein n=1 Tax=Lasiosphaeria ovina TaxID=92902 RepID=A0AAE0N612_9PEZI|nr:hypothetical protein B0T24DRAFT_325091 [Lasiosphaeria ovina]